MSLPVTNIFERSRKGKLSHLFLPVYRTADEIRERTAAVVNEMGLASAKVSHFVNHVVY